MFGKDKNEVFAVHEDSTTLISRGTVIEGNIRFAGNLEIEGKVKGNIVAEPGAKATARVLEAGCVSGELSVPAVIINGSVEGNVFASEYVELASKARVMGDVHYSLIEMVKGSQVNGSLVYRAADKAEVTSLKDVKKDSAVNAESSQAKVD